MKRKPKTKASAKTKPPRSAPRRGRRGRGRPAGAESGLLDKNLIISIATQLARSVPLSELSIVRIAHELGVTPALIHYYLGGRDALTSGVMNAFYKELIEEWPTVAGADWQHRLEVVAGTVYRAHVRYPGIAAYVVSHNRFRMIQNVEKGETDYGIEFFERFTSAVQSIGFDAPATAIYAHLLMEFITTSAHATMRHMWPGEHRDFLDPKLAVLESGAFPATHFVRKSLTSLNASAAFTTGLRLYTQALELNREQIRSTRPAR
jgi:AcrR family transcriptional regulator